MLKIFVITQSNVPHNEVVIRWSEGWGRQRQSVHKMSLDNG